MTLGSILVRVGIVFALVLANAFFVAAEFALVAARRSRIEEMAARGDRAAALVHRALGTLDRYISATQLGITLASLALGWLGEDALAALFDHLAERLGVALPAAAVHTTAAAVAAFLVITFLHIVMGELMPKSLALVRPEGTSKLVARPLLAFAVAMSPFIWLLNGAANALLRLVGVRPASETERVHSPEELRLLVMQSRAHGALNETDSAMLAGVFDFHEKRARDVMRPRTEITAIPLDATEADVWRVMREERYTRYPVTGESLDDIVGVLLAKDLWLKEPDTPFDLSALVRVPLYVPDTRLAERVLDDLRRTRAHMAVVLDEYGGTAGILTLEDLVEEVIGDINDEYDIAVRESLELNGVLELSGTMSLVDVRSDFRLAIPEGDWTTVGGYTFAKLGRVARIGDRASFPGGELEVVAMDGRRVAAVRVHRTPPAASAGSAPPEPPVDRGAPPPSTSPTR